MPGQVAESGLETKGHRRLEATTMALYVSIVLLAELLAVPDDEFVSDSLLIGLIWGTTLGLAIAHWVAFRMASRLIHDGLDREDLILAMAQLSGAASVAVACTIPTLLMPADIQQDWVRIVLALLLGLTSFAAARHSGHGLRQSLISGGIGLVTGMAAALIKNALSGH